MKANLRSLHRKQGLLEDLAGTVSSLDDIQAILRSGELDTVQVVVLHGTVLLSLSWVKMVLTYWLL